MTAIFFDHWREAPLDDWRWPNFSPAEIACRGTGRLQALRDRLGKPLIVRSAYRSPEHNRAVGGATRSKHLDGAAFNIAMAGAQTRGAGPPPVAQGASRHGPGHVRHPRRGIHAQP